MKKERDMLNLAKTVERCQRNFDWSKPLPNKHVKYILDVATCMPTKQNQKYYNVSAIESEPLAREFYVVCCEDDGVKYRNSQVYAPLLLIWSCAPGFYKHDPYNDISMSCGISSSAAALTAASLGYKTGFCKCINDELTEEFFMKHFGRQIRDPMVALGIGHPLEGFDRTECVLDGKVVNHAHSCGDKKIMSYRYPKHLDL